MKQHTIDDIKTPNAKLKARHLVQINRLLNDVREADDPEWRRMKVGGYLLILDMVHVDGKAGSLVEDGYYVSAKTPETAELDDYAATMDAASNRGGYG